MTVKAPLLDDYYTIVNQSFQDQLDAVEASSKNKGFDYVDLSLLTDGLKSERGARHYHRCSLPLFCNTQSVNL